MLRTRWARPQELRGSLCTGRRFPGCAHRSRRRRAWHPRVSGEGQSLVCGPCVAADSDSEERPDLAEPFAAQAVVRRRSCDDRPVLGRVTGVRAGERVRGRQGSEPQLPRRPPRAKSGQDPAGGAITARQLKRRVPSAAQLAQRRRWSLTRITFGRTPRRLTIRSTRGGSFSAARSRYHASRAARCAHCSRWYLAGFPATLRPRGRTRRRGNGQDREWQDLGQVPGAVFVVIAS